MRDLAVKSVWIGSRDGGWAGMAGGSGKEQRRIEKKKKRHRKGECLSVRCWASLWPEVRPSAHRPAGAGNAKAEVRVPGLLKGDEKLIVNWVKLGRRELTRCPEKPLRLSFRERAT
ncbi:hypothetical protein RRG08_004104 [Elysia crispata]|uniref:Uncharacterized protein n=1 Tax=Elysia crispata TaxID=231223 RepID=A0AAE1AAH2_9GAST|nr:hypothetical protein RRG08_004104 [Elysia crispata]